ncbi:M28 family peptidase [Emcibacter sp.]|uniref:M28 family peptidase n=1 Tax=Emcibacter sp. TaxID=1979954 RepID=UPI002AA6F229|nr:M28 family peptidase [Emcibacter sp.]
MLLHKFSGTLAVLAITGGLLSQPLKAENILSEEIRATALELKETALDAGLAYELDESLSTEVGARRVGTPGDKKGVEWAVAKMKALGFDKVWTEEVTHVLWERGEIEAEVTGPYPHTMTAIALGGSVGSPKKGIEAEVVEFENFAALEAAAPGSLDGKIAYVSYRMERKVDGSGYGPAVIARGKGALVAEQKGAVAFIMRSVGTDNNRLAHTGSMNTDDGIPGIAAAALSNPDADILSNLIRRGKPVTFKLKQSSRRHDKKVVKTANVIGEVTGRESPEDYVILGSHLDSWDVGTGAVDDGIGVTITMAAGKHILDLPQRPKRSVRVVLFGAEEVGLVGVEQYLEAHKDELDHHVIGAEWDFGVGRIYDMKPGVGPEALNVIREMAELFAPMGVSLNPANDAKGQSDLSLLGDAGMPAVNFSPDGSLYFDYHHTDNDTFDKVDPEAMKFNTAIYTMFTWIAAESGVDFRK